MVLPLNIDLYFCLLELDNPYILKKSSLTYLRLTHCTRSSTSVNAKPKGALVS